MQQECAAHTDFESKHKSSCGFSMYSIAILIGTPLASLATGFAREWTALILLEFCSSLSWNSSETSPFWLALTSAVVFRPLILSYGITSTDLGSLSIFDLKRTPGNRRKDGRCLLWARPCLPFKRCLHGSISCLSRLRVEGLKDFTNPILFQKLVESRE